MIYDIIFFISFSRGSFTALTILSALLIALLLRKRRFLFFFPLSLVISFFGIISINYLPIFLDEKKLQIFENMGNEVATLQIRDTMILSWISDFVVTFILSIVFYFILKKIIAALKAKAAKSEW